MIWKKPVLLRVSKDTVKSFSIETLHNTHLSRSQEIPIYDVILNEINHVEPNAKTFTFQVSPVENAIISKNYDGDVPLDLLLDEMEKLVKSGIEKW